MHEKILNYKVEKYITDYGDNALKQAIKHKEEKLNFHGKDDYIEITYYQGEEPKHLLLIGDVFQYSDYIIAKINSKHKILLIKKVNGVYYPLEMFDKEEFL